MATQSFVDSDDEREEPPILDGFLLVTYLKFYFIFLSFPLMLVLFCSIQIVHNPVYIILLYLNIYVILYLVH